tara:strand:+ start:2693 stop:3097 length:405 start_codon:yes stop_codon:yes gene_type:complete
MACSLTRLFRPLFKRSPVAKKVIFIGIDYLCFSLSKSLLDNNKHSGKPIEITAFIDDEPWNNRTVVNGATVFSPSEIAALVQRNKVDLIIQIQGESIDIADNIWENIVKTNAKIITLHQDQDMTAMQQSIYNAY